MGGPWSVCAQVVQPVSAMWSIVNLPCETCLSRQILPKFTAKPNMAHKPQCSSFKISYFWINMSQVPKTFNNVFHKFISKEY